MKSNLHRPPCSKSCRLRLCARFSLQFQANLSLNEATRANRLIHRHASPSLASRFPRSRRHPGPQTRAVDLAAVSPVNNDENYTQNETRTSFVKKSHANTIESTLKYEPNEKLPSISNSV